MKVRPANRLPGGFRAEEKKMALFRKKPILVEAFHFTTTDPCGGVYAWDRAVCGDKMGLDLSTGKLVVPTANGEVRAAKDDWIVYEDGELRIYNTDRFVAAHEYAASPETFSNLEAVRELEALAKSWVWTVPFVGPNDAYIRANADADCADQVLAIIGKIGKPK